MSGTREAYYERLLKELNIRRSDFFTYPDAPLFVDPSLDVSPCTSDGKMKARNLLGIIIEEAQRELSQYRQRKEDLIARIATDWPVWGTGLDFYIFFIKPLYRNPLLLHFINRSEGIGLGQTIIKYGFVINENQQRQDVEVKFKDEKLTNKAIADLVDMAIDLSREKIGKDIISHITDLETGNNQEQEVMNPSFSVKAREADIGAQAFFSFLEGVMRNAAKHRSDIENKKLETRIVYCDNATDLESLFQNKDSIKTITKDVNKEDCSYVVISVNTDVIKNDKDSSDRPSPENDKEEKRNITLVQYLNQKIKEEIINEQGEITPGNWGLKEMKICAAYLSGADVDKLNKPDDCDYVCLTECPEKVWRGDEDKKWKRFCYILRLEKPKNVLVVNIEESNDEKLQGIKTISWDNLKCTEKNLDYDFLLFDETNIQEVTEWKAISHFLPQRKVKKSWGKNGIGTVLDEENGDSLVLKVYDAYLKHNLGIGIDEFNITIDFGDDTINKKWQKCLKKPEFIQDMSFASYRNSRTNDCKTINILRHSGIKHLTQKENGKPKYDRLNKKIAYQKYGTHADLFFSYLYSVDPGQHGDLILRRLVEAAALNILVIDERIAQIATEREVQDQSAKVSLVEQLYWMGIYIAKSVQANGNTLSLGVENTETARMVNLIIDSNINTVTIGSSDCFSGHKANFSILDEKRIEKTHKDESEEKNKKEHSVHVLFIHATKLKELAQKLEIPQTNLVKYLKENIPWVIVHSGRGTAKKEIPDEIPFLEYSTLQRYLVQEPSKFFLTQIAMSAKGVSP